MPPRVSLKIASKASSIESLEEVAEPAAAVPPLPPSPLMLAQTLDPQPSSSAAARINPRPAIKPGMSIPIDQVDKAMFPLNLFPSREELQNMHEKYDTKNKDNVTLPEFIEMVEHLTFAHIDESTRLSLFNMYKEQCLENDGLTRQGLQGLLYSVGDAQHTFEELDQLMQDWDVKGTGRLTFDAFLSIVAMDIKQEEKERAFEKDFERFCPKFERDSDIENESQRVTVKSLMSVFQKCQVPITEHIAEEMIFDADLSKYEGSVSYDDLIATITMFQAEEIYDALSDRNSKTSQKRDKTSIYKSMTHRYK